MVQGPLHSHTASQNGSVDLISVTNGSQGTSGYHTEDCVALQRNTFQHHHWPTAKPVILDDVAGDRMFSMVSPDSHPSYVFSVNLLSSLKSTGHLWCSLGYANHPAWNRVVNTNHTCGCQVFLSCSWSLFLTVRADTWILVVCWRSFCHLSLLAQKRR